MHRRIRNKIAILIGIVLISILLIVVLLICRNSKKEANINISNGQMKNEQNISIERIDSIVKENIKDRSVFKEDNYILIGENIKQLENGFYDIKFELDNEMVIVYVNKLWKDFNENLYEEKYIDEVITAFQKIFDVEDDLGKLREDLKEEYINTKNEKENVNGKTFELSGIKVDLKNLNKEVVMTINY